MTSKTRKNHKGQRGWQKRALAVMMTVCLLLGNLNLSLTAYAAGDAPISITVGDSVTAVLEDGVLKLTGQGETYDFEAETAPFLEYKDEIQTLNIEDGITYLGACLFYNLGSLSGELILPAGLLGIGDSAFSGDNQESAPKFTQIRNLFVQGELRPAETPKPEETATPEETIVPEETVIPEETIVPGETVTPVETVAPEETVIPEETITPEETVIPEETTVPDETQTPLPSPDTGDAVPDESNPPQTGEGETQEPGQTQQPEQNQDANTDKEEVPSVGEGTDLDATIPTIGDNSNVTEVATDSWVDSINDILLPHLFVESTGESQNSQETEPEIPTTTVPESGNNSESSGGEGDTTTTTPEEGGGNETTTPEDGSTTPGEIGDSGNETVAPGEGSDNGTVTPGEGSDNGAITPGVGGDNGTITPGEGGDNGAATPGEDGDSGTSTPGEGDGNTEEQPPSEDNEIITQQQIVNPTSIFYEGQTGIAVCSAENLTFIEAVKLAGYQVAERLLTLTLDDTVSMELPVADNQVYLPECPGEIKSPDEDTPFFTYEFSGWTESSTHQGENVLSAGHAYPVGGMDTLSLYSVWNSVSRYQLKAQAKLDGDTAVYSLINGSTGEAAVPPAGYTFLYQWQIADKDDTSAAWTDISGAGEQVYRRTIEQTDSSKQFRCKVTVETLARSMSAAEPLMLYSDAAAGVVVVQTVYVDQANGSDDTGDGTQEQPVKTFDGASKFLKTAANGGSIETNHIVILGTYVMSEKLDTVTLNSAKLFGNSANPVPVTISGADEYAILKGYDIEQNEPDMPLKLQEDICIKSIKVEYINHIYGYGHDITVGEAVVNSNPFYLYGSGKDEITEKIGEIDVQSGKIDRIAGYVRSKVRIDAENKLAEITVGGKAQVATILAGIASGEVENGNTEINITGGKVETLVGGNQGYQNTPSPYAGKTSIRISGGSVTNLYGAGTGRNVSIPSYLGTMDISVTGGKVGNLYGAGSAAFVISTAAMKSAVNISVTGSGEVENIFAAGKGDDNLVKQIKSGSDESLEFLAYAQPEDFGSLTGDVNITIGENAVVTGNIYASGKGATTDTTRYTNDKYNTKKNAYLNGQATITVNENSVVKGNIYGGGKGITEPGYEECARVTEDSKVKIVIAGGTVEGNVYGGGENGRVKGKTEVEISGGIIKKSVYGVALGQTGNRLVFGGSTVNMTSGWIQGNLYGGSELSNDGPEPDKAGDNIKDLIFVNLVGGTVKGNVFGGGYRGIVNGSTHLHIGLDALNDCTYYKSNKNEQPLLEINTSLSVEGSVYAGGDYGGDGKNYDAITVLGTSHVYIDGKGYQNSGSNSSGVYPINIAGGVFGSGASCDAGSTRLVTLEDYGIANKDDKGVYNATHTITSIQRADRVLLNNAHVRITGQSDVANTNQTALYSVNRIGNHGPRASVSEGENALVLKGGSTLILDSAVIETANFKSIGSDNQSVKQENIETNPNTIYFNTGTEFRISYTKTEADGTNEVYGSVTGYAYMLADEKADAYAYARLQSGTIDNAEYMDTGGFLDASKAEIQCTDVTTSSPRYRYWKIGIETAISVRNTVLTAQKLAGNSDEVDSDGYAVAKGSIQLPPTKVNSSYTIKSVVKSANDFTLVDAAKNSKSMWIGVNDTANITEEKNEISAKPVSTFGMYMETGTGFGGVGDGKVVSDTSINSGGSATIIDTVAGTVSGAGVTPHIDFYLTYYNSGITSSKSLGKIVIELENSSDHTKTEMNVEIVTKASELSDETVELYATQSGSYSGKLIIPSGASRKLSVIGVEDKSNNLVANSEDFSSNKAKFSITMQPAKGNGWSSVGLMDTPYDLKSFKSEVPIGTTDDRHEAAINFTLRNNGEFTAKEGPDQVILKLKDSTSSQESFTVTLNVNWKASVVTDIGVTSGRQYNETELSNSSAVEISPNSSVTASFKLRSAMKYDELWLELENKNSEERVALPQQSKWTLLGSANEFYSYKVSSTASVTAIHLNEFFEMWGTAVPTGQIAAATVLTVIVDFSETANLSTGEYSLHLRSNTGADPEGADFTISPDIKNVTLDVAGGLSRGSYNLTLTINPCCDTRIKDGAAVVLSPEEGDHFPKGVKFQYGQKTYYPSNDKVYLPLSTDSTSHTITMDTKETVGLSVGPFGLSAQIYPISWSAGKVEKELVKAESTYVVSDNPVYGLQVKSSGSRVIKAGGESTFEVNYINPDEASEPFIAVSVQKKVDGGYVVSPWDVKTVESLSAKKMITVTVPENTDPGTYRLIFELGDRKVPYNIIVT